MSFALEDALIVLRTPLQACIARQLIKQEKITEYDLVYLTHQNSEEDKYYFSALSSDAAFNRYVFVPARRPDIINHFGFRWSLKNCFRDFGRKYVVIGSIDSPTISGLAAMQKRSVLLTVDDGTANINCHSTYHDEKRSWRYRTYASALGAEPLSRLKQRIERHYSIYKGIKNIVDPGRVRHVEMAVPIASNKKSDETVRYFIGQPVRPEMRLETAKAVRKILSDHNIDLYVQHPREVDPMNFSTKLLNKEGRIAEEAIFRHAAGRQIQVYSGFSSATFNIARFVKSANIFMLPSIPENLIYEYGRLAKLVGCTVWEL